jgi:hypothetical protein
LAACLESGRTDLGMTCSVVRSMSVFQS